MGELFGRRASLRVDLLANALELSGLRFTFRVTRTSRAEPDDAEIRVYNLKQQTRDRISALNTGVDLSAGYREDLARVFAGEIIAVDSRRERTEWVTTIQAQDGALAAQAFTEKSWREPDVGDVIEQLATDMGVSATKALEKLRSGNIKAGLKTFLKGFVASGRSLDTLDTAASQLGLEAHIRDQTLILLEPAEALDGEAVRLTPRTGLISSPRQLEDNGLELVSLLNGKIVPGRRIELESANASGSFRAVRVVHDGDTHGAQWSTTAEVIPL